MEVVDANVLLEGQRENLLGPRLEGGPVQVVNLHPSVPVHHPEAEVPGVAVLEVLEGVGRDDDPGTVLIRLENTQDAMNVKTLVLYKSEHPGNSKCPQFPERVRDKTILVLLKIPC